MTLNKHNTKYKQIFSSARNTYKQDLSGKVFRCFKNIYYMKKTNNLIFEMLLFLLLIFLQVVQLTFNNQEYYTNFAVSSELPQASEIGLKLLNRGGNAIDAAIATCIAVGIVNAFSSGLGGGGFVLIKKKGLDEEPFMLDFRERAGENFKLNEYINNKTASSLGGTAVGVPAEIKGLFHIHKKFGRLPWKDLFKECIELCKGFSVTKELEKRLIRHNFEILKDPGLREIYSKNGQVLKEGDIVVRENYMRTLKILANNPNDFYQGEIAEALLESINKNGGNITKKDFLNVKPIQRTVIVDKFKDYKVYATSLPSSGVLVVEALKLLEFFDIKKIFEDSKKNNSYQHIHILVEILKFVMARRGELGDPDFLPNHEEVVKHLLSKENLTNIYKKIDVNSTLGFNQYNVDKTNVVDGGTTHINVVDTDGMIVSLTSTINLEWGAKFMDPVTGIILNNQIDDFYFPKDPNADLSSPNIGKPEKIPLSSASPLILEKDNELIVLGAAGGIRIPTSIIEVVFWISLGFSLREAIEKPRLHHQLDPHVLFVEYSESPDVIKYLEKLKHTVKISETNSIFTSVQGIQINYRLSSKNIYAISDHRKGGRAAGL